MLRNVKWQKSHEQDHGNPCIHGQYENATCSMSIDYCVQSVLTCVCSNIYVPFGKSGSTLYTIKCGVKYFLK